ncbi:unnamed protein product [Didymodactylos carnosus]|uniref:Uncharacterized protein n=1 Tax=Didymodactylos carnosus TaxID=1234261 RepID=A0A813TWP5_9BILA|nr:unnamed protein product [Didymodactylos carnosus]CAF3605868.1 unnamed protein product [Didymodactylos carnosus]
MTIIQLYDNGNISGDCNTSKGSNKRYDDILGTGINSEDSCYESNDLSRSSSSAHGVSVTRPLLTTYHRSPSLSSTSVNYTVPTPRISKNNVPIDIHIANSTKSDLDNDNQQQQNFSAIFHSPSSTSIILDHQKQWTCLLLDSGKTSLHPTLEKSTKNTNSISTINSNNYHGVSLRKTVAALSSRKMMNNNNNNTDLINTSTYLPYDSIDYQLDKAFVDNNKGIILNPRGRFVIPSSQNSFGGLQIALCAFDDGCTTLLLPLPSSINDLCDLFPSTEYLWSTEGGAGVGIVSTKTLKITSKVGRSINCELSSDLRPWRIQLDFLRFDISCDEPMSLLRLNPSPFNESAFIDLLEYHYTIAKIDKRNLRPKRKSALIGRSVTKTVHTMKVDQVLLIIDPATVSSQENPFTNLMTICSELQWVKPDFCHTKLFNDCFDEEHGSSESESYEYSIDESF